MKKVKKLLTIITLMTVTSTLVLPPQVNAAVINETKENIEFEEMETETAEESTESIEAVKKYEEMDEIYTEKEATSTSLLISSFTSDLKSPQEKGTTIKLAAKAQGGSGTLQYSFVVKLNDYYREIKAYSTSNTVSWKPQYIGNYVVYAVVKDSTGKMKVSPMNYEIKEVSAPVITSFTADKKSPQSSGTEVKLTANATGKGTLQYKFLVKNSAGEWNVIRDYGTSNTTIWKTGAVGDKTLYVDVKNSAGKVTRKEMSYKVTSPLKINSFIADKKSPQVSGTEVKLTAKAEGIGTLKYKFLIKDSKGNWYVIRDYDASNTTVWKTGTAGDKTLYVDVKDNTGKVVRKEMSYKVTSQLKINSFTADKQSPQVSGTSIKLKASATGTGKLQYKFLIKDSAGNWYVLKDYSTTSETTWTAGSKGDKTLYVDVKDSTGKKLRKSMNFTIKTPIKLIGEVVKADGDTDSTNNEVLPNATVKITKGNVTQTTKTNSEGIYSFEKLISGTYTITVSKEGYKTATQIIEIPDEQASYYNSTIELISNTSTENGTASGAIYDVLTGNGVKGLTLKIRSGMGNTTGTIVKTIKTGEDGKYSVALPAGNYCVQIIDERTLSNEKDRYLTNSFDIKTIGNKTIGSQNGNVSTAISAQQVRIVLKWGEYPRDLDSHLVGPTSDGSKFHTYFSKKGYYEDDIKIADLDLDDTSSYGPETTTIYNPISGKYQFYVHDYSNRANDDSLELSKSGAIVQVYIGASNKPAYTFNVPKQKGTLWKVFEYDSVTKKIKPINEMSYERYASDIGQD
ncbi:MAG: carboxypeptidase regulatory-like domain-containing protein [Clostridium sp.]